MTLFVRNDTTLDDQLQELGLKKTGKSGYPLNGQLYLGRGGFGSNERGIYRSTRTEIPREGFSGADIFEFLEVIDPSGLGAKAAESQGG